MIFFTSDTHFNHANIIRYCNRPFKNVTEMDETLIANWNSVVGPKDTVYHLGDFCFGNALDYLEKLNGFIYHICGNHEKPLINAVGVHKVPFIRTAKIPEYPDIIMSHFAMRVWNKSHFNSWHLYGHSHGTLPGQGKSFDVGVDCWEFRPVSLDQITFKMAHLPDNFNYLRRLPGYDQGEFEAARQDNED